MGLCESDNLRKMFSSCFLKAYQIARNKQVKIHVILHLFVTRKFFKSENRISRNMSTQISVGKVVMSDIGQCQICYLALSAMNATQLRL